MPTGLSFYLLPNIEIRDEWMVKRPIEAVRRTHSMHRKGSGRASKKIQERLREGFTPAFHGASVLSRYVMGKYKTAIGMGRVRTVHRETRRV